MHLANLSLADAFKSLGTSEDGLTPAEAARRLGEYGHNHLEEVGAERPGRRLLREFTHFFAIILWIAAGLAFYAESKSRGEGMWQLGVAIVAVILINGCFSYWQEYRAERGLGALRQLPQRRGNAGCLALRPRGRRAAATSSPIRKPIPGASSSMRCGLPRGWRRSGGRCRGGY